MAVGRLGCFFAGLPDYTYGVPTDLPWGVNFGDGVPRHPVQLYESAAMLLFLSCICGISREAQLFSSGKASIFLWDVMRFSGSSGNFLNPIRQ